MKRPIETERDPCRFNLLGGCSLADEEIRRISTCLERQKTYERHTDDDDDALKQPSNYVGAHAILDSSRAHQRTWIRLDSERTLPHRSVASKTSMYSSLRAVHWIRFDTP